MIPSISLLSTLGQLLGKYLSQILHRMASFYPECEGSCPVLSSSCFKNQDEVLVPEMGVSHVPRFYTGSQYTFH